MSLLQAGNRRSKRFRNVKFIRSAISSAGHVRADHDRGDENVELQPLANTARRHVAVVCLGQTGAGKSSTVNRVTLQHAEPSDGFERKTQFCQMFHDVESDWSWVDTMGWQDDDCEDAESMEQLLRFLRQEKVSHVGAVIWNVIPNVRKDATVTRHAALVNSLVPSVWSNVIVVCKQAMNPNRDGAGVLRAALQYCGEDNGPQITGYRFLSDLDEEQRLRLEMDEGARRSFNIKTDAEVRQHLRTLLARCSEPISLSFCDYRCTDCGVVDDPRLMPLFCHLPPPRAVHPPGASIAQLHPEKLEKYHSSERAEYIHEREPHGFVLLGKRHPCCGRRPRTRGCVLKWACCSGKPEDPGCRERFPCCSGEPGEDGCQLSYDCCGAAVNEGVDSGCELTCRKCDRPWGSPADGCFRRSHNLVDVEEEEEKSPKLEQTDVSEKKVVDVFLFGVPPLVISKPF